MRSKRRLGGLSCRAERLPAHTHVHPNSSQKIAWPVYDSVVRLSCSNHKLCSDGDVFYFNAEELPIGIESQLPSSSAKRDKVSFSVKSLI